MFIQKVLVGVTLAVFLATIINAGDDGYDICEDFGPNVTKDAKVVSAFFSNTKFYLLIMKISNDMIYVHEDSRSKLENSPENFTLEKGHPLSTKWPALWNFTNFQKWIKEDPYKNSFGFFDENMTAVVFTQYTTADPDPEFGVPRDEGRSAVYYLDNGQVDDLHFRSSYVTNAEYTYLSTDVPLTYYALNRSTITNVTSFVQLKKGRQSGMSGFWPIPGSKRYICQVNKENSANQANTRIYFTLEDNQCVSPDGPVTWKIARGFVLKGKIYYFSEDRLLLFEDISQKNEKTPTDIKVINFANFFQCKGAVDPQKNSYTWVIPLVIVMVLLMIILCIILFCVFQAIRRKKKKGNLQRSDTVVPSRIRSGISAASPGKLDKNKSSSYNDGNVSRRSYLPKKSSKSFSKPSNRLSKPNSLSKATSGMQSRRSKISRTNQKSLKLSKTK